MIYRICIVYYWLRRSEWCALYFVSRESRELYEEGIVSSTEGSSNGDVSFSTGCGFVPVIKSYMIKTIGDVFGIKIMW